MPAIAGALVIVAAAPARAAERPAAVADIASLMTDGGSSSREARRQAVAAMGLERMAEPQRKAVEKCLRATTLYRHLPPQTFACNGDLLAFSLHKPETIVDLWRVLGISRLSLDPAGAGQWRLSDGYGTVGALRLVHRESRGQAGVLVFHGRGAYSGSLSPRQLSGTCVLLVRHSPAPADALGRARQTVQIDAFLDMDGMGLEIVTRTLQPLIVRSAAANFHEICLFMTNLSAAAEENPDGVARLAARLARTEPADRQELARIARAVGRDASRARPDALAADPQRVQAELAARWLPAEQLDSLHR
jgi:hypothetical protein